MTDVQREVPPTAARVAAVCIVAALAVAIATISPGAASDSRATRTAQASERVTTVARECTAELVPVNLGAGLAPDPRYRRDDQALAPANSKYKVHVRVCVPTGRRYPRAVQVLVHGITYDSSYWNLPDPRRTGGEKYSWEAAATKAGYATVAVDRIGSGASSRPPSLRVDMGANVRAIEDVVRALRSGHIAVPRLRSKGVKPHAFRRIVLVGHSGGSVVSSVVASRYRSVDALIMTGASHHLRQINTALSVGTSLTPAALDPRFAKETIPDLGYLTLIPGRYRSLYYAPSTDFDAKMPKRDERDPGTVTISEIAGLQFWLRTRLDVRVPTLFVVGSLDSIFCSQTQFDGGAPCSNAASLTRSEQAWMGPRVPSLSSIIVPGAGHALNAMRTAPTTFERSLDWLRRIVPPR